MTGRNVGYARVSTADQDLALQVDALKAAGCDPERIYADQGVSGALSSRPGLDACLEALSEGDTLVVWKLDRLGRSLQHLTTTVAGLGERGVGFRSLTEGFDTTSNSGKLLFHIMGALAEFERGLITERTMAGVEAARAKGKHLGRPWSMNPAQRAQARAWRAENRSVVWIAGMLGVSRGAVYRALEVAA